MDGWMETGRYRQNYIQTSRDRGKEKQREVIYPFIQ